MEKQIDPYYQKEAKRFIDSMFDAKAFNEKLTRDDMQGYEDLLAYYFQAHHDTTKKCLEFTSKLSHLK